MMGASPTCVQAEMGVQLSWSGPSSDKTGLFVFYLQYCEVRSVKHGASYMETSFKQEALMLLLIRLVF